MLQPPPAPITLKLAKPYRFLAYFLIICMLFATCTLILGQLGVINIGDTEDLDLISIAIGLYALPILCFASIKGSIPPQVARFYPRDLFEKLNRKSKFD
jgi:hypothetical protein